MQKILITGCAGFIGSFLARALIKKGNHVIGIDNFEEYYARKAKEFNLDLIRLICDQKLDQFKDEKIIHDISDKLEKFYTPCTCENISEFKFIECDIRDVDLLEKVFDENNIDKVIHLAAMAGVPYSMKQPSYYSDVNLTGTTNLLELSARYDITRFLFGSSSSIYGQRTKVPFKETDRTSEPISPYAASKKAGEVMCHSFSHTSKDLYVTVIRIFGPVYGPLQRPYGMAAQRFIRQVDHDKPITIYGDGTMARDSTYIDDMVNGFVLALESEPKNKNKYNIINIGTGKPISVIKLAKDVIELFGKGQIKHIKQPSTEVPITYADISKAKESLGYIPKVKFEEGLKRQFEIYKMMPQWYKDISE